MLKPVFLVMSLLSIVAVPQTASAQKIGVLVGFNFANVDLDFPDLCAGCRVPGGESKAGFVGGVTFNHLATDLLGFEVDVLLSMKGTKENRLTSVIEGDQEGFTGTNKVLSILFGVELR